MFVKWKEKVIKHVGNEVHRKCSRESEAKEGLQTHCESGQPEHKSCNEIGEKMRENLVQESDGWLKQREGDSVCDEKGEKKKLT